MAVIQHSAIPDGQRHEPKGISTASSGQVYVANGAGSGEWTTPGRVVQLTASLTPTLIGANTSVEQTFTVTGLQTSDKLLQVIKPTHTTNLGIVGFRIVGANSLGISFMHIGGAGLTPPAETYTILVWR
jgi:hypothetical protein